MTVSDALTEALSEVTLKPADRAAVALARSYAEAIDAPTCPECERGGDLVKLGPLLLAVLTALGMTPAARKAVTGKGGTDAGTSGPSPIDELRQRRAARQRAAAAVDTTAT